MPLGKQFAGMWTLSQQLQAISSGTWTGIFVPEIVGETKIYAWGSSTMGKLGLNDGNFRSSPTQVGTNDWALMSLGQYHSFATKQNGALYTWGRNSSNGELGLNDLINRSSPTQVGSDTDWPTTGNGLADHNEGNTLIIKSNGTLWVWGYNSQAGQLGIGTTIDMSSPVQVGALTNWAHASGGVSGSTGAVKTDGTLWTWGQGSGGSLGDNTIINKSSPIQIGSDTNWSKVFKGQGGTVAIKTNGTMWAWGGNLYGSGTFGANGDNTDVKRSSPVQIGSDTNWASVAVFNYQPGGLAIRTTGSLWVWGAGNSTGRFGRNELDSSNVSSPIQVGALTNWSMVSGHNYNTGAIKTDGTLWAWGASNGGILGDNTVINRSSPVQIGSDTTWNSIRVGDGYMLATKDVVVAVPGYFTYP